jgi:hypothetical protein
MIYLMRFLHTVEANLIQMWYAHDDGVYLTPKSPLHRMERGLDHRFSPPLRWVERGFRGEVNTGQGVRVDQDWNES